MSVFATPGHHHRWAAPQRHHHRPGKFITLIVAKWRKPQSSPNLKQVKLNVKRKQLQKEQQNEYLKKIMQVAEERPDGQLAFVLQDPNPKSRASQRVVEQTAKLNQQLQQSLLTARSYDDIQHIMDQHGPQLNYITSSLLLQRLAELMKAQLAPHRTAPAPPPPETLVERAATLNLSLVTWFQPAQFAIVATSLAKLGVKDADVWEQLIYTSLRKLGAFTLDQLVQLLDAVMRVDFIPSANWTSKLEYVACRLLHRSTPDQLALLVHCFAALGNRPRKPSYNALVNASAKGLKYNTFKPEALARLVVGLSKFKDRKPSPMWLQRCERRLVPHVPQLGSNLAIEVLYALVALGHRPMRSFSHSVLEAVWEGVARSGVLGELTSRQGSERPAATAHQDAWTSLSHTTSHSSASDGEWEEDLLEEWEDAEVEYYSEGDEDQVALVQEKEADFEYYSEGEADQAGNVLRQEGKMEDYGEEGVDLILLGDAQLALEGVGKLRGVEVEGQDCLADGTEEDNSIYARLDLEDHLILSINEVDFEGGDDDEMACDEEDMYFYDEWDTLQTVSGEGHEAPDSGAIRRTTSVQGPANPGRGERAIQFWEYDTIDTRGMADNSLHRDGLEDRDSWNEASYLAGNGMHPHQLKTVVGKTVVGGRKIPHVGDNAVQGDNVDARQSGQAYVRLEDAGSQSGHVQVAQHSITPLHMKDNSLHGQGQVIQDENMPLYQQDNGCRHNHQAAGENGSVAMQEDDESLHKEREEAGDIADMGCIEHNNDILLHAAEVSRKTRVMSLGHGWHEAVDRVPRGQIGVLEPNQQVQGHTFEKKECSIEGGNFTKSSIKQRQSLSKNTRQQAHDSSREFVGPTAHSDHASNGNADAQNTQNESYGSEHEHVNQHHLHNFHDVRDSEGLVHSVGMQVAPGTSTVLLESDYQKRSGSIDGSMNVSRQHSSTDNRSVSETSGDSHVGVLVGSATSPHESESNAYPGTVNGRRADQKHDADSCDDANTCGESVDSQHITTIALSVDKAAAAPANKLPSVASTPASGMLQDKDSSGSSSTAVATPAEKLPSMASISASDILQEKDSNGSSSTAVASASSPTALVMNLGNEVELLGPLLPRHFAYLSFSVAFLRLTPDAAWMGMFIQLAQRNLHSFQVCHSVDVLHGLASIGYIPPADFMQDILRSLTPQIRDLTPQGLVMLLSSLSRLGFRPSGMWMTELFAGTGERLEEFKLPELSGFMVGVALMGETPASEWMEKVVKMCTPLKLDEFVPSHLANLLWALATLRYKPAPVWLRSACRALQQRCTALDCTDLGNVAWSLVQLKHRPSNSWLQVYLRETNARMQYMDARSFLQMAWALAVFGTRPSEAWLSQLQQVGASLTEEMTPAQIEQLSWSIQMMKQNIQDFADTVDGDGMRVEETALAGVNHPSIEIS